MACPLVGAKPLSEPMLEYCWFGPYEQFSVKFQLKVIYFHSTKCVWKCGQEIGDIYVSASMCWHPKSSTYDAPIYGTHEYSLQWVILWYIYMQIYSDKEKNKQYLISFWKRLGRVFGCSNQCITCLKFPMKCCSFGYGNMDFIPTREEF